MTHDRSSLVDGTVTEGAASPGSRPRRMRAAVLHDVGCMTIRDVERPGLGPRDVLVRVTAVGLCGTDFHIFAGHANYHLDRRGQPMPLANDPQILGHEIAGVIAEVGPDVHDLVPGDRVVLDQGLNCLSHARDPRCEYCVSGDSHQCEHYAEHGITGLQGGLAEYVAIPAVNAVKRAGPTGEGDGSLGDRVLPDEEAALTEPLACIIHSWAAVRRAHARYAVRAAAPEARVRTVLVAGAGPAGLLFIQYLRQVVGFDGLLLASEPDPHKRALAASFGAEPLDPRAGHIADAVLDRTDGRRVECLIDASGSAQVFVDMPGLLRKQGTVLLYAHGQSGVDLGVLNTIQFKEPTLVAPVGASGGFGADGRPIVYREALGLLEAGRVRVQPFITHRYRSLEAVPGAFGGAHREGGYVKGVALLEATADRRA